MLLETHVEKDSTTMGGRDLFQERFFFRKKEKEKEENAAINLREISKQQASNQRIDSSKLLRHFFERLSVVLQRENGAMLIERSPLNSLPGHVDGCL